MEVPVIATQSKLLPNSGIVSSNSSMSKYRALWKNNLDMLEVATLRANENGERLVTFELANCPSARIFVHFPKAIPSSQRQFVVPFHSAKTDSPLFSFIQKPTFCPDP